MSNRFRYERRALDSREMALIQEIRERADALATLVESLPHKRETETALISLEQAVMWACKAVVT